MKRELKYPFDPKYILSKRRSLKKELLSADIDFSEKRIAILGGSTTHDIREILELFLLDLGIRPTFYESGYGLYWQDAMFDNPELLELKPDIIFIHTSTRNIHVYPSVKSSAEEIEELIASQYAHYETMWDALTERYNCPIIQNNFEMPYFRIFGNMDASDPRGRVNYISRLNSLFYKYAQEHGTFYINDINYLSACYGLDKWAEPLYWHMYKYALAVPAIPYLSYNIANIIKSLSGMNKKAIVVDLDNTLWGGVIGDDGIEGVEIGRETPTGQIYSEFQEYLKLYKDIGINLNVSSKNEYDNALEGLNHPEAVLKPDDFLIIKADWRDKDQHIREIASEINIGTDSLVFLDDNPVERDIVASRVSDIAVPDLDMPEDYIRIIDRSGFFEVTNLSGDDLHRNEMYEANIRRERDNQLYESYEDYLKSLEMSAVIRDFDPVYLRRIVQLINKTNQFNLTSKRFTENEIASTLGDDRYIRLYGKLSDRFGDNGVVTAVLGHKDAGAEILHINLWIMSCRVFKRNMEHAMMDELVSRSKVCGLRKIRGYYYKTEKNAIVKDFYGAMGFDLIEVDGVNTVWELEVENYKAKNNLIKIYR